MITQQDPNNPDAFRCGRRDPWNPNSPFLLDKEEFGDKWRDDGTCNYCGSMKPEAMLAAIKDGTATLIPTDKSYKVYAEVKTEAGTARHKFYFQHFSPEQQGEFISLYNDKTMQIGVPGYFYTTPYFCQHASQAPKEQA